MRPINLAAFDLNLLIAFEALYEERHVSRAGAKIGLSQPSMSHALKRLRETFGDELFTRGPGGMTPTAHAVELARHILPSVGQLRTVMSGGMEFDPGASDRRFVIGLNDLGSYSVLPRLTPALRSTAPGVNLTVVAVGSKDAIDKVASGEIEIACGVFQDLPREIESHKLTGLASVCVSDRRNPRLIGRPLDLDAFLELPHVQIAVNADPGIAVDVELAALSVRRRIIVVVPHFLAMPGAVLGTDMIGVMDSEGVQAFQGWTDLRFDPLPLDAPGFGVSMVWNRRNRLDPGHRWLRELIAEQVGRGPGPPPLGPGHATAEPAGAD